MAEPEISVIVVTYNQENTIGRTLDSILGQQTDATFEIVVGDDCSSDGTEAVCREYARRYPGRVVYLRRERNLGVVGNYFDCIARSRGRFLADCAGDDFWVDTRKLQKQVEILRHEPEVSMVLTDWLACDPDGTDVRRLPGMRPVGQRTDHPRRSLLVPILTHATIFHLCTALYRKDILLREIERSRGLLTDSANSCEDHQILLSATSGGSVVMLPDITLHYSVGHESISHSSDSRRRFLYTLRDLRQTRLLRDYFGISPSATARYERRVVDYAASQMFRTGEPALRDELRRFLRETGLNPGTKGRVYLAATAVPPVWKGLLKFMKNRRQCSRQ